MTTTRLPVSRLSLPSLAIRARRWALSALALAASAAAMPSWAARDFTPQAGTWIISEELDGKPGRGLAIDVQGNTFFMQVFGYERNGDATFYTATGQMDGNTVTAPLMRYQGGRSFGSDARDAVEDGSPGAVTVSFANGLQGTVQFPGEQAVAMQRFQMMSADFADAYWTKGRPRIFWVTALDTALQPRWQAQLRLGKGYASGKWELIIGGGSEAGQRMGCERLSDGDTFHCTSDAAQTDGYRDLGVRELQLQIADADVSGTVRESAQNGVQTSTLMGITVAASGNGAVITGCGSYAYAYVGDIRNCGRAISPSNGTWVVEDELLGKPGRGLTIDVQNGMALTQIFNYLPGGAPTFHMGSGSYQGYETAFPINRYQGGRAVGGPPASGSLAEAAGQVALLFSYDGTSAAVPNRTRGSVQLPGEPVKKIVRMALESDARAPQSLLGQWWMTFRSNGYPIQATVQLVNLTKVQGDTVSSDNGDVRCTRPQSDPYRVECLWQNGSAYFLQEANNRSVDALQVRDRHSNLMGLGKVPLD